MSEATFYNPDIPRTGSGIVFAAEVAISSQQVVLTLSEHSCLRGARSVHPGLVVWSVGPRI
jgi:hypothetical protein